MRLRQQRHVRSCGLACVAIIANQPYNAVLQDYEDLSDEPTVIVKLNSISVDAKSQGRFDNSIIVSYPPYCLDHSHN